MKSRWILLIMLGTVGSALAGPPEFIVKRIGVEQGLSQSNVYSILRDSHGFMWFGTGDGLDRYDGFGLAHFRHRPRDSTSLPGSAIRYLAEDSLGHIWIGTGDVGAAMMDRRTGHVRFFRNRRNDAGSLSSNTVTAIVVDRTGIVWIGTSAGLDRVDPRTGRTERFIDLGVSTYQFGGVRSLVMNRFGDLAVTGSRLQQSVVYTVNPVTRRKTLHAAGSAKNEFKFASCIGLNPTGEFLFEGTVGDESQFMTVPRDGSAIRVDAMSRQEKLGRFDYSHQVASVSKDLVWTRVVNQQSGAVGLYVHRCRFNADGLFTADTSGPGTPLVRGRILSFQPGQPGVYWVGTADGVYRLVARENRFPQPLVPPFGLSGLPEQSSTMTRIRSILIDREGDLWVGTDDALYRHDQTGWHFYFREPQQIDGMTNSTVNVIYEDVDGTLLFGTNDGVLSYDRRRDRFRSVYNASGNLRSRSPHNIWSMARDPMGNFWVGTLSDGLYQFDRDGRFLERFVPDSSRPGSISHGHVWSLLVDRTGSMWVGTAGGLDRWVPATRSFLHYRHADNDSRSLPGNNIWWLHEDQQGTIWIGVYGGGIARYDRATSRFASFTTQEGLSNDGVYCIQSHGTDLWISSNVGITRFDTRSGRMRSYDSSDGLQSNEFAYKASFKGSDGELYFGGIRGITRFHPDRLQENSAVPGLALTSFRIFDSVVHSELFDGDSVEIDYDSNRISFEMTALDFLNPERNQYSYKLEGYDGNWSRGGNQRYVSYTGLPPGDYTLHLRGSNSDGVWNMPGIRIPIRVIPPFWMTLWFKGLLALAAVAVVALAVAAHSRSLRRREEQKHKLLESQLQGLRSQMNPHFIFNSLNAIQNFIVHNAGDSASEYLAKFARLMRMVLEHSQHPLIPVAEEIAFLELYLDLEGLRFEHRFESTIEVDPQLNIYEQRIPSMLVQPYVENAIRHGLLPSGKEGSLTIRFSSEPEGIICTIEDNGIGREASLQRKEGHAGHRSIGMSVTSERLELLNSLRNRRMRVGIEDLIDATTGAPLGTRVTIHVPGES